MTPDRIRTFFSTHKSELFDAVLGLVGVSLVAVSSYSFGRASVPPAEVRVEENIVEVEVEKEVEVEVEKLVYIHDTKTKVHRMEVTKPDGTVVKTEDIDHDTHTDATKDRVVEKIVEREVKVEVEKLVEVSKPQADWRISPLVGVNIPQLPTIVGGFDPLTQLSLGVQVERRILGPASVGVWGLHTGQVGVSFSLEF